MNEYEKATARINKKIYGSGSNKPSVENPQSDKHGMEWTRHTWRAILCGPNGTGKTTALLYALRDLTQKDEVYILSKKRERSYERLIETFDDDEENHIHFYTDINEFPDVRDLDEEAHKIIIFDDHVNESGSPKIIDYFILGRKSRCACFFITQAFYPVHKTIRSNCSHFALFKTSSYVEAKRLHRELCFDITQEEFLKKYDRATNGVNFLWINTQTEKPNRRYMKSFILPI